MEYEALKMEISRYQEDIETLNLELQETQSLKSIADRQVIFVFLLYCKVLLQTLIYQILDQQKIYLAGRGSANLPK